MVKLILLIILAVFIVGIGDMLCELRRDSVKVYRRICRYSVDPHTPSLISIRARASAAFDLVENGNIKREVLLNEAEPYDSVKSVKSFIGTLSNPTLVKFISTIKEVNYHE